MVSYSFINNNLVYKTDNGIFFFTHKKNKAKVGNKAIVRIVKDKNTVYMASGVVKEYVNRVITIEIKDITINKIMPPEATTLYLAYKKDNIHEMDFNKSDEEKITVAIGQYQLAVDNKSTLFPKIMKFCKDCAITLAIKNDRDNIVQDQIPKTLRTIGYRRPSRIPKTRPTYIPDFDKTGGSMCGKKTKTGKVCKIRGKCRYH